MFIPCFRYTTVLGADDDVYSLFGIINEYWNPVCEYAFFSVGDLDVSILKFSRVFIISYIIALVLFAFAVASIVYVTVNVFKYFKEPEKFGNGRILFLALVPNRIAAFLWQLPMLALLLFPRYIIYLFRNILAESATVSLTFPEPLIIAAILYALSAIFSISTVSLEKAKGMNAFTKRKYISYADEELEDEI